MKRIHEGLDDPGFPMPVGITTAVACNKTGKLALDTVCAATGSAHTEYYAEGTVPKEYCNGVHSTEMQLYVCALTGQVATESCPYKVPSADINLALGYCPHSLDAAAAAAAAQQNAALQQSINDANAAAAAAAALQQQLMSGFQ